MEIVGGSWLWELRGLVIYILTQEPEERTIWGWVGLLLGDRGSPKYNDSGRQGEIWWETKNRPLLGNAGLLFIWVPHSGFSVSAPVPCQQIFRSPGFQLLFLNARLAY